MSIRSDIPQIKLLRERVESRFGKRPAVHSDFLALVAVIEKEQRQHISESTLERVWGYSTRGYATVSLHTLDVLSHYAEGCSWNDFCNQRHAESGCESELFNAASISAEELAVGDRLQIGWLPDRLCTVRYLGENRFIAEECHNAKMQAGDRFSCLQFSLGKELIMSDVVPNNANALAAPQTYLVGRHNGLTTLRLLQ